MEAAEQERRLSILQSVLFWITVAAFCAVSLFLPNSASIHLATLVFTAMVVFCLWDEPVWNEPLGRLCPLLSRLRHYWPIFLLPLFTSAGWMPRDGSALNALVVVAALVSILTGIAERKTRRAVVAGLALSLSFVFASRLVALIVFIPFFQLVFRETVSRTKGRLDGYWKAWIALGILAGMFFAATALSFKPGGI